MVMGQDAGLSQLEIELQQLQLQEQVAPDPVANGPMPHPSTHKEALNQLLQVLRSPNTREQQQQILQILKSNPQLMAAFIKQRQTFQAMQRQQQQHY